MLGARDHVHARAVAKSLTLGTAAGSADAGFARAARPAAAAAVRRVVGSVDAARSAAQPVVGTEQAAESVGAGQTGSTGRTASAAVTRIVVGVRALQAGAGLAHLKRAARAAHAVTAQLPVRAAFAAPAAVGRVTPDGSTGTAAIELSRWTEPRTARVVAQHAFGAGGAAAAAMGGVGGHRHAAFPATLLSGGAVRGIELTGVGAPG